MLRTLIQATALTVTLIASFFWIRGSAALSVKDIAALAGTYWGHNPAVLKNLASQKADSLIAAFLLLLSFILQGINMAWPMRFNDFEIDKKGLVLAVIISFFVSVSCYCAAKVLANHFYSKAQILLQQHEKGNEL